MNESQRIKHKKGGKSLFSDKVNVLSNIFLNDKEINKNPTKIMVECILQIKRHNTYSFDWSYCVRSISVQSHHSRKLIETFSNAIINCITNNFIISKCLNEKRINVNSSFLKEEKKKRKRNVIVNCDAFAKTIWQWPPDIKTIMAGRSADFAFKKNENKESE